MVAVGKDGHTRELGVEVLPYSGQYTTSLTKPTQQKSQSGGGGC